MPWWGLDESLAAAGALSGKVVIDVTNPYKDESYSEMHDFATSGAEEIAEKATGARLVKGWNHTYAQTIYFSPDFGGVPASVFICGDDAVARRWFRHWYATSDSIPSTREACRRRGSWNRLPD